MHGQQPAVIAYSEAKAGVAVVVLFPSDRRHGRGQQPFADVLPESPLSLPRGRSAEILRYLRVAKGGRGIVASVQPVDLHKRILPLSLYSLPSRTHAARRPAIIVLAADAGTPSITVSGAVALPGVRLRCQADRVTVA